MYAVLEIAGYQFKVEKGAKIDIPKLPNNEGEELKLKNVLLYVDEDVVEIGTPVLSEYTVLVKVEKHYKGKKIIVHKYKKRKNSKVTRGHRQDFTVILIEDIFKGIQKKAKPEKVKKTEKKAEKKKPAPKKAITETKPEKTVKVEKPEKLKKERKTKKAEEKPKKKEAAKKTATKPEKVSETKPKTKTAGKKTVKPKEKIEKADTKKKSGKSTAKKVEKPKKKEENKKK